MTVYRRSVIPADVQQQILEIRILVECASIEYFNSEPFMKYVVLRINRKLGQFEKWPDAESYALHQGYLLGQRMARYYRNQGGADMPHWDGTIEGLKDIGV